MANVSRFSTRAVVASILACVCVPALAIDTTWTFDGDGNWTEAANWSNGEPIDETFNVFIDDGDSAVTVTLNESRTIGGLTLGMDDVLRIEALSSPTTLTSAHGFINDGSILLRGTETSSTVALTVDDGALINSSTGAISFFAVNGSYFHGDLLNDGSITVVETTTFNKSGGNYINHGDFLLFGFATLSIENGTLEHNDGLFRTGLRSALTFSNGSTFNVTGGQFEQSGHLNVSTDSTLNVMGGYFELSGNSSTVNLSGGGTLNIAGGTFDVSNGTLNIYSESALNLTGGVFEIGGNFWPSLFSEGRISLLPGGTMKLSADVTGNGILTQTGGTLEYESGTISGTYEFLGGTVIGTPHLTNATLYIGPGASSPVAFVLEGGTTTATNSILSLSEDVLWEGQTLTVMRRVTTSSGFTNSGALLFNSPSVNGSRFTVTNGTLVNSATGLLHFQSIAGGEHSLYADLINNGTVIIEESTYFAKAGGIYSNHGHLTISDSQILTIWSDAQLEQNEGILDVDGTVDIRDGSHLELTGGVLNLYGGIIGDGTFTQSGGLLNYISGGISGIYNYLGGTVDGVPVLTDATLTIGTGATDFSGFVLQGNSTLSIADNLLAEGRVLTVNNKLNTTQGMTSTAGFTNHGSFFITGTGSGTTSVTITNGAIVNSENGTISFQSGGTGNRTYWGDLANHGSVLIDHSTTFSKTAGEYANDGTFTIANSENLTISGGAVFEQIGGTLNVLGTLNQVGGSFRYLGGAIHGTPILRDALLLIGTGATDFTDFVLEGNSTISLEDNLIGVGQMLTIRNAGTGNQGMLSQDGFVNDGSILITGTSSGTITLAVSSGVLENSPTGLLHFQAGGTGSRAFSGHLTNNGTVLIERSTTFNKPSGVFSNSAQFTIDSAQTLTITDGGSFEQSAGTLDILGTLSLTGGSVFEQLGGSLDISGSLNINSGTLRYLGGSITGTAQLSTGILEIGPLATAPASFLLLGKNSISGGIHQSQVVTARDSASSNPRLSLLGSSFTIHGSLLITGPYPNAVSITVDNSPLIISETGLLHFQSGGIGTRVFTGDLINNGSVIIDRSTEFTKSDGVCSNRGQFSISTGERFWVVSSDATFEQADGTLDIQGTLGVSGHFKYLGGTINGTPTIFNGGTLSIGPGVNNPFSFVLGGATTLSLADNVLAAGQTLTINGGFPSGLTSANGFASHGAILFTGSASLSVTNGTLINETMALLHFQAGSAAQALDANLINDGTVRIENPTTFRKTSGTYINNSSFTLSSGLTITNGGAFEQVSGTFDYNTTSAITGGTFRYLGGTIIGNPLLTSVSLDLAVDDPIAFTMNGSSAFSGNVHQGQSLTIRHDPAVSAGPQGVTAANGFTNGGSIFVIGQGNSNTTRLTITDGTLVNSSIGLLRFHSGTSSSKRAFNGNLTNYGTVQIDASTEFSKSGAIYEQLDGELSVNSTLTLSSASQLLISGGALNLNGIISNGFSNGGEVTLAGGTLNYSSGSISRGTFNYLGGMINGVPTLSNLTLNIGQGATEPASFVLVGDSFLTLEGNRLPDGYSLTIQADFPDSILTSADGFTNDGAIRFQGESIWDARMIVSNGTLTNGETGLIHFLPGPFSFASHAFRGNLLNHGTVQIDGSTTFDRLNGIYANYGLLAVANSQILSITNGGAYEQVGGMTVINGTLFAMTTATFAGGSLQGKGVVKAPVENAAASVAPGESVGTLTVQNNYTQLTDATLAIELAGTAIGQFDVLAITGVATLAGTLDVSLINDFVPGPGRAFPILTAAGGITGTFTTELLPGLPDDLSWNVFYGSNAVTLAVGLPGDFNSDGTVNAADYTTWRDTDNTPEGLAAWQRNFGLAPVDLSGDYNHDGVVNAADYTTWRDTDGSPEGLATWQRDFGLSYGSGTIPPESATVPEPSVCGFLFALALSAGFGRVACSRPREHVEAQ